MSDFLYYLQFPFVANAFAVGCMIALCAALLGVPLVLKRYSFIGDGLSHVAFGAMALAGVLNLFSDLVVIMPITVLAAVCILRMGQNTKIKGDAAIALLSVSALAFGYVLMNVFSTSTNVSGDVCSTLFGSTSLLNLSQKDVLFCLAVTVGLLVFLVLFYYRLFAVTFDEDFLRASKVRIGAYNTIIAIVTAVIIVLGMRLVGTLLISALIIFPALSAMRLFQSFRGVMLSAAVISVLAAASGMLVSIQFQTPVGATIVLVNLAIFLICAVWSGIVLKR